MTIQELKTKKIAVLGLGVNNRELVRYLAEQGIAITIRDRNLELKDEYEKSNPHLAPLLSWELGENTLDRLEEFEVIFRSPGISFLAPQIQAALKRGVIVSSQTKLFFDLCPATIIGVTGTKGKGTTSTLIYQMLLKGYKKGAAYFGGNIGTDPFSFLENLRPEDMVVMELSSFQLQDMEVSPHIAVVLGITPDHLNLHASVEEYIEAKVQLIAHQNKEDIAIINDENPAVASLASRTQATLFRYGKHTPRRQSAWVDLSPGEEVAYIQIGETIESLSLAGRKLRGEHNLENILPALLVASLLEVPRNIMQKVAVEFAGLPHRLTHVGSQDGVDFYEDGLATVPQATQAALRCFPTQPIHLIAGGRDKGSDYEELARDIIVSCASLTLLPGEASKKLKKAVKRALSKRSDCRCVILDKAAEPVMETALSGIHPHLKKGDVVLLSPACASSAPFANSKERGDAFTRAVIKRYLS